MKNSQDGQNYSETNLLFSSKEICSIIESCGTAGVNEFQYGGLNLSFGAGRTAHHRTESLGEAIPEEQSILTKIQDEEQRKAFLDGNLDVSELELEEIRIAEPELWEEFITSEKADEVLRTDE